jgi:RHS repeat-associated protein
VYTNDDLGRLIKAESGNMVSGAIQSGTKSRYEDWTLSLTGNWSSDKLDINGDGTYSGQDVNVSSTCDKANKYATRGDLTKVYYTPGQYKSDYVTAGGFSLASRVGYQYDAFGRMTGKGTFNSAGTVFVATKNYRYNGLGHRIMEQWDEDANDLLDADERLYFVHDSRWRQVAAYRDQDANPKEAFIYHAAGVAGRGGSLYVDCVILRDRDDSGAWTAGSDGVLEQRRYYVQNWRADVTALLKTTGEPVEWIRYTAYGTPTVHPIADIDADGDVDSTDYSIFTTLQSGGTSAAAAWLNPDLNRDDVYPQQDDEDYFVAEYAATVGKASGFDQLSTIGNRKGYAGYERDESLTMWHVRHRVLDSKSGKWNLDDPFGYPDGISRNSYVRCRPNRWRDPLGLFSVTDDWGPPAEREPEPYPGPFKYPVPDGNPGSVPYDLNPIPGTDNGDGAPWDDVFKKAFPELFPDFEPSLEHPGSILDLCRMRLWMDLIQRGAFRSCSTTRLISRRAWNGASNATRTDGAHGGFRWRVKVKTLIHSMEHSILYRMDWASRLT